MNAASVTTKHKSQGIILIIVLTLLSMLFTLAIFFVMMTNLEKDLIIDVIHVRKAHLLSQSAIEYAIVRLRRPNDFNPNPADDWQYRDDPSIGLSKALHPSYANGDILVNDINGNRLYDETDGDGYTDVNGNGQYDGYSGRLRGTKQLYGDTFSLKIIDNNDRIHINGHNTAIVKQGIINGAMFAPQPSTVQRLSSMVDNLCTAIGSPDLNGTEGTAIQDGRPFSEDMNGNLVFDVGFATSEDTNGNELLDVNWGDYTSIDDPAFLAALDSDPATAKAKANALEPFISFYAWEDENVIVPAGKIGAGIENTPSFVFSMVNTYHHFFNYERDRFQPIVTSRAPVNVNHASEKVLYACLRGIFAIGFDRTPLTSFIPCDPISDLEALEIVGMIDDLRDTKLFTDWHDFKLRLRWKMKQDPIRSSTKHDLQLLDLILASANPNTDLNKGIPDWNMYKRYDKSDLVVHTTEFSFSSSGNFDIASLGIVRDQQGEILASQEIAATVKVFEILRHTTQKDFVGGRSISDNYIEVSTGSSPTYGAAKARAGNPLYANHANGLSLMTYPEPLSAVEAGIPAVYDGQIGMATLEMDPENLPLSAENPTVRMYSSFADTWDADVGVSPNALTTEPGASRLASVTPTDTFLPRFFTIQDIIFGNETLPPTAPNLLRPDGYLSSPDLKLMYNNSNLPHNGDAFLVGFWMKTQPELGDAVWPIYFQALGLSGIQTSFIIYGAGSLGPADPYSIPDYSNGFMPSLGATMQSRWTYFAASRSQSLGSNKWINNRLMQEIDGTGYTSSFSSTLAGSFLTFGSTFASTSFQVSPFVIDDIAIVGMEDPAAHDSNLSRKWGEKIFDQGRYYNEDDGTFYSPEVQLDPGSRLMEIHWTEVLTYHNSDTSDIDDTDWDDIQPGSLNNFNDERIFEGTVNIDERIEFTVDSVSPTFPPDPIQFSRLTESDYQVEVDMHLPNGRFEYEANFVPATAGDDPLYDSMFLDDITFIYRRGGGAKILRWVVK